MHHFRRLSLVLIVMTASSPLFAGGLIQKLPEDGAWVKFDMEFQRDGNADAKTTGHWTIRAVGTERISGKKYRWIEFDRFYGKAAAGFPGIQRLVKHLVPEQELVRGGDPPANLVRSWYRFRVGKNAPQKPYRLVGPQGYRDNMLLLPASPPKSSAVSFQFEAVKQRRTFPYQRGEFKCESAVRETYAFVEKDPKTGVATNRGRVTFTVWKHTGVPFGVAGTTIAFKRFDSTGKVLGRRETMTLSVSDFGANAKTAFDVPK